MPPLNKCQKCGTMLLADDISQILCMRCLKDKVDRTKDMDIDDYLIDSEISNPRYNPNGGFNDAT